MDIVSKTITFDRNMLTSNLVFTYTIRISVFWFGNASALLLQVLYLTQFPVFVIVTCGDSSCFKIPLHINVNSNIVSLNLCLFDFSLRNVLLGLIKINKIWQSYLKTDLINTSFWCLVILGEGNPSWESRLLNHIRRLSQYSLFNTKNISLKTSIEHLGAVLPEKNQISITM